MANTTTTVNMSDTREVVVEPPKPPQLRLKQYVALQNLEILKSRYSVGDQVRLTETDAVPFIASNQISPLDVALRNGLYPISKETLTEKVVEAVTGEEIPDTPAEVKAATTSNPKSFLGNALRDAIQKKKAETNPELSSSKIDADKLAAIKAGGVKK